MLIPIINSDLVAIVDDADAELVIGRRWYAHKNRRSNGQVVVYATTFIGSKSVYMHRLITGAPKRLCVDHKNHNGLDNRRSNLRVCTPSQNNANKWILPSKRSRYRGVHWNKANRNWVVHVKRDRKAIHVGVFSDEQEAARAYDSATRALHGEFAVCNFRHAGPLRLETL